MITLTKRSISIVIAAFMFTGLLGFVFADNTFAAKKKIHLKKTSVTLSKGKTFQQKLLDKKGKTIKATKVKWKSAKKSVAKIDKKGKIKAIKVGTAKMTAKYKGKTYKFTVKVKLAGYSQDDFNTLSDVLGFAQIKRPDLIQEWAKAGYPADSTDIKEVIDNFGKSANVLELGAKITKDRIEKKCVTQELIDAGYTTWDELFQSMIKECREISNKDISTMTPEERNEYGLQMINEARILGYAWIELLEFDD